MMMIIIIMIIKFQSSIKVELELEPSLAERVEALVPLRTSVGLLFRV